MGNAKSVRRTALFITIFLILVTAVSAGCLFAAATPSRGPVAEIYQNGVLIRSIPLDQVSEPFSFLIEGENGGRNLIEVRPGSIGVLQADCPDQICVRQGFIDSPLIPVACVPNGLVILIRNEAETVSESPDLTTY